MRVILGLVLLVLCGCGGQAPTQVDQSTGPVQISAANHALAWLARSIGGDLVTVDEPFPADADPAFWAPDDDAIRMLQAADLVVCDGGRYARWLTVVSLAADRVIDAGAAAQASYLRADSADHQHGPDGAHQHGAYQVGVWFDRAIILAQADAIAAALVRLRPREADAIQRRREATAAVITELFDEAQTTLMPLAGGSVHCSHPVYGYLARTGGVVTIDQHWEPDQEPDDQQWAAFAELASAADVMWWEAEPAPSVRARLEHEFGIQVVIIDGLGTAPDGLAFPDAMRRNLARLRAALSAD